MNNPEEAKKYIFAIHKIREAGGVNYSKPNIVNMMKLAENRLTME